MLRIWGRLSSINVRKVVWAAQEVGIPFERIEAGGASGMVNSPDYRQMNPNAMAPVLQDGDLTLWESNTIVRYLCAKYAGDTLYPGPLEARFKAERWNSGGLRNSPLVWPAANPSPTPPHRTLVSRTTATPCQPGRAGYRPELTPAPAFPYPLQTV